jgi:hypothetical protein
MAEDGGPAFPLNRYKSPYTEGMTLRDYFAVHAPNVGDGLMWNQGESSVRIEAARAYRWADAMLAERKR